LAVLFAVVRFFVDAAVFSILIYEKANTQFYIMQWFSLI